MAAETQSQQQSWTAWILDAYSQSAITSMDDSSDDSSYESMSPTASSPNPNCPTHGEYLRTGRGGVGNTWSQSVRIQKPNPEVQTVRSLKERRGLAINIDTTVAQSRSSSQYIRVGRTLQYIQSNEPQMSPVTSTPKLPSLVSSPVIHSGRGGAGNFGASAAAAKQAKLLKEQQDQIDSDKRRQEAEQHVVAMLQPPSSAYMKTRRRSTLPDNFEFS